MALWRAARLGTGGKTPLHSGVRPRGWLNSGTRDNEIILV